ncbi:MAG: MFS transporter [Nitrososphaerales archaeon]
MVLASIDLNIVLIALPSIFRGIQINPLSSFQYLLWLLFGYSIVTATLLVSFGRISDMLGRVRLYNLGFAIYTVGSLLLFLTPSTGPSGALELIFFRIVQGIGGAFLMSNSVAIITDAFPPTERGKALGINQVSYLVGSVLGLILGGVLATLNWRYVFLISVPFGLFGTVWSYLKLKELATIKKNQKLDIWGNVTFASGLILLLVSITYGINPYHSAPMGWSDPFVVIGLISAFALLAGFLFIETRVEDPMFRLDLFKRRIFATGIFAGFLQALARGGVTFMFVILLQAVWLPLHGISYQDTPLWAGIYMLPYSVGFVVTGPLSGHLSDRFGGRGFSTLGMLGTGICFLLLSTLSYNFNYLIFAALMFASGAALGTFMSPNTASVMNSVPPQNRGAASGMRSTMQNMGYTIGTSILFTIVSLALATNLPGALATAATSAGAPQLGVSVFRQIAPTTAIFSAFLGFNPMQTILNALPQTLTGTLSTGAIATLTSNTWFPSAFAPAFMSALRLALYINAGFAFVAAIASALGGKRYLYGLEHEEEAKLPEETVEKMREPQPQKVEKTA